MREKRLTFFRLMDASEPGKALLEVLQPIQRPVPPKRPCYEGVHVAIEPLLAGAYWRLFEQEEKGGWAMKISNI